MEKTCVVFVTVDSGTDAAKITSAVLEKRLVSCVNAVKGVSSSYWWKGKIEKAREILLVMKTRSSLSGKLTAEIKKHHPYTVPEIIFMDIKSGNRDYLEWIAAETKTGKKKGKK